MGAVLTPSLIGVEEAGHLPNASTFCGRCEAVCPMRIPLPKMMRHWREREFEQHQAPPKARLAVEAWAFLARRPRLYRWATGLAVGVLGRVGRRRGRFSSFLWPAAGPPIESCRPRPGAAFRRSGPSGRRSRGVGHERSGGYARCLETVLAAPAGRRRAGGSGCAPAKPCQEPRATAGPAGGATTAGTLRAASPGG